jgi:DNA uptake protein ComE-like DNA-binding protein
MQIDTPARRGMILIVVTIVLVMISLAGFGFVAVMYTENKAAHLNVDEIRVDYAAASGTELLKAVLAQGPAGRDAMGGLFDNPDLFKGQVLYAEPGTDAVVRFSVLVPRIEEGQFIGMRYGAENESARINLSTLAQWDQAVPDAGRKALMQLPDMTDSVADAIMDWLDADSAPRSSGAEADYYSGLDPPIRPRNGPVESLEELLLVKGVARELLFGTDTNQNHSIEPDESNSVTGVLGLSGSSSGLPWAAYLTLYSGERNVRPNGTPRIDINHADLRALYQALSGALNDSWVRFIIAYRQFGPYTGSEAGQADATLPLDLNPPAKYKIESLLDLINARVSVPRPSSPAEVFQSPFTDAPDSLGTNFLLLEDHVTVDKLPVLVGRININSAPREVIAGVPGMPETEVEQILAGRGIPGGSDEPSRRHPTWLLAQNLVSLDTMKKLMPYLTCGGDVYRAQIVGYFDSGTPAARADVVINATGEVPRQVYYKDLRLLGRGFDMEMLRGEQLEGLPTPSTADFSDTE